MMTLVNKLITLILVPLFMNPFLPFLGIAKLVYPEKEVISLSEHGIGTAEDPVFLTAHRGITAVSPENTIPASVVFETTNLKSSFSASFKYSSKLS